MSSICRVLSRIFSTARANVEKEYFAKQVIKRRMSKAGGNTINFAACLPGVSMMYIIGMHQRSLKDLELSEEEEQAQKERVINRLMEKLGLTPEQPYCYFHNFHKEFDEKASSDS